MAKSLVYRIYAFLDGARSSGILDPYKSWLIDVIETSTGAFRLVSFWVIRVLR